MLHVPPARPSIKFQQLLCQLPALIANSPIANMLGYVAQLPGEFHEMPSACTVWTRVVYLAGLDLIACVLAI